DGSWRGSRRWSLNPIRWPPPGGSRERANAEGTDVRGGVGGTGGHRPRSGGRHDGAGGVVEPLRGRHRAAEAVLRPTAAGGAAHPAADGSRRGRPTVDGAIRAQCRDRDGSAGAETPPQAGRMRRTWNATANVLQMMNRELVSPCEVDLRCPRT